MAELPHRHLVAPWLAIRSHRDWWLVLGVPGMLLAIALMWPHVGWWAVGVAIAVYACGYLAYTRFLQRRRLTSQIATALGRLAELNGATTAGHAERSATVAVAVGRRLGVEGPDLAVVGHAARARHVGRVGLDRPTHPRPGFDPVTVAEWSAAILRRAPGLEAAAGLVVPLHPEPVDSGAASRRNAVQVATDFDEATCAAGLPADQALVMAATAAGADAEPALNALGRIFGVVRPA